MFVLLVVILLYMIVFKCCICFNVLTLIDNRGFVWNGKLCTDITSHIIFDYDLYEMFLSVCELRPTGQVRGLVQAKSQLVNFVLQH